MKKQTKMKAECLQITVSGSTLCRLKTLHRLAGGHISVETLAYGALGYAAGMGNTDQELLAEFAMAAPRSASRKGAQ